MEEALEASPAVAEAEAVSEDLAAAVSAAEGQGDPGRICDCRFAHSVQRSEGLSLRSV